MGSAMTDIAHDTIGRLIMFEGKCFRPWHSLMNGKDQTVYTFGRERDIVRGSQFDVGERVGITSTRKRDGTNESYRHYLVVHTKDTKYGTTGRREVWSEHALDSGGNYWSPPRLTLVPDPTPTTQSGRIQLDEVKHMHLLAWYTATMARDSQHETRNK